VNNGEYRALSDPANAPFLTALASGRVPPELGENNVNLRLEDKRAEEYVPPAYTAFSGGGNSLAAAADADTSGMVVTAASEETFVAPVVDESKPTGAIQVRLITGKKMAVKLNLSHTVGDLVMYINANGGGECETKQEAARHAQGCVARARQRGTRKAAQRATRPSPLELDNILRSEQTFTATRETSRSRVTRSFVTRSFVTRSFVTRSFVTRSFVTRSLVTRSFVTRSLVTRSLDSHPP